jgi:hypothetical protein
MPIFFLYKFIRAKNSGCSVLLVVTKLCSALEFFNKALNQLLQMYRCTHMCRHAFTFGRMQRRTRSLSSSSDCPVFFTPACLFAFLCLEVTLMWSPLREMRRGKKEGEVILTWVRDGLWSKGWRKRGSAIHVAIITFVPGIFSASCFLSARDGSNNIVGNEIAMLEKTEWAQ